MDRPAFSEFSAHLFWDVDLKQLSWEKHTAFVVGRVLDYGVMEDWRLLRKYFSIDEIADYASTLRSLTDLSLNLLVTLTKRDKSTFRCTKFTQFEHHVAQGFAKSS